MNLATISAKEAKNSFGDFLDRAQRGPIMITKRDRPVGVFFSMHDVTALMQLGDTFKAEIHKGVLSGISDIKAGRIAKHSSEHTDSLKKQLQERLLLATK